MSIPRVIVIASANAGKIREIRAALAPLGIDLPSLPDLALTQTDEPHNTFLENALAKARHAAAASGQAALADDSGLVTEALNGAPGTHSARYAGAAANDERNNQKLLDAMKDATNRRAFYYAAMILVRGANDPAPAFAEGFWRGEITTAPRGSGGFGYDPIFYDPQMGKTGAEMTLSEKATVSHRGQSLRELLRIIKQRGN